MEEVAPFLLRDMLLCLLAAGVVLSLEVTMVTPKVWRYPAFLMVALAAALAICTEAGRGLLLGASGLEASGLLARSHAILVMILLVGTWTATRAFPFLRDDVHEAIVKNRYCYPYQHRLLVPMLVEFLRRRGLVLRYGYLLLRAAPFWVGLLAWSRFFSWALHLPAIYIFFACFILVAYLPLAYHDYWLHNTDAVNFWIFAVGIHCLLTGAWGWLAFLVFVGTWNRESPFLFILPAALFGYQAGQIWAGPLVAVAWGLPYAFLRFRYRQPASREFWVTIRQCFPYNLKTPRCWLCMALMFLPWVGLMVGGDMVLKPYSRIFLIGTLMTTPWMVIQGLRTLLDEPRFALPLVPIWIGLALRVLAEGTAIMHQ